jgi:hypothetical protein
VSLEDFLALAGLGLLAAAAYLAGGVVALLLFWGVVTLCVAAVIAWKKAQ